MRRSRRASTRSSCSAISGRSAIHGRSEVCASEASRASVSTVAEAVRGPGSNSDSSPNMSLGPMTDSMFSRPSAARRPTFTLPLSTMYSVSPCSPSAKTVSPRV